MTKPKILFVLPSMRGGGAEKAIITLLRHFDREKFLLGLVLLEGTGEYLEQLPKDIALHILNKKRARWATFNLAKLIGEERPDILVSALPQIVMVSYLALSIVRNKPFWVIRKDSFWLNMNYYPWVRAILRKSYKKADLVISVSKNIADDLVDNWGVDNKKLRIILNPLDVEEIRRRSKEKIDQDWLDDKIVGKGDLIVATGRLVKVKGFTFLIKAMGVVSQKRNSRLLILGQGEEKSELIELSKALGIENKVIFLGFQKNPYKFMARADVFVLPSLSEGLPIVLIEALGLAIPVVATDTPGSREVLENGKSGLLVPLADEDALAEGILELLEKRELANAFSAEAKKRAAEFTVEKIMEEYETLFNSLVK